MKRATISDAPAMLNINDRAMWVLGFNEAVERRAPRLLAAIETVVGVIDGVDQRCMAADGPVTPTNEEITPTELQRIYDACKAALHD